MTRKGWKAYEMRIAKRFGTDRNPLSGGGSKHTGSDTLHPGLFIDVKIRREVRTLWRYFRKLEAPSFREKKKPVLVVKVPGARDSDSVVACRLKDLKVVAESVRA